MAILSMIFTNEELERITRDGDTVKVDVHKMTKKQARRFLSNLFNVLKRVSGVEVLEVCHGFNNGIEIKKMINKDYKEIFVGCKELKSYSYNPGLSYITI